ncbi:MAG: UDP-glucose/GDP-mannose dehydrogenase family protein [Oscillospiraceae bacterium]|nr:UDP-glucose/GDP-mannose dehydrogenase family protein [Oscillospiraceae bacterium]
MVGKASRIACIGAGYVGLATSLCLAGAGFDVTCADRDAAKVASLSAGRCTLGEAGMAGMLRDALDAGRLRFTVSNAEAIAGSGMAFICVWTPQGPDGKADLSSLFAVARDIGANMAGRMDVVVKSTVPAGTARKVREAIVRAAPDAVRAYGLEVLSCPEFLRESSAIRDTLHPSRVVIGCDDDGAALRLRETMEAMVAPGTPFVMTGPESAETLKYAANAFLSMKVAFINEVAGYCEAVGADVRDVSRGLGMDDRIGPKFLAAGPGFSGGCFPKDLAALLHEGRSLGVPLMILEATAESNMAQRRRLAGKVATALGDPAAPPGSSLRGRLIAILGLSFKQGTGDMRDSVSLYFARELCARGASLSLFDPEASQKVGEFLGELMPSIKVCPDEYGAAAGADAVVILTDWPRFAAMDLGRLGAVMGRRLIFDYRNVLSGAEAAAEGFEYHGVGV